jgi:hypothetical protein
MKKIAIAACVALGCAGLGIEPAHAQSSDGVEQVRAAVLNLIRALVDQGVLTAAKAQDMLRQAGLDPALLNAPQTSQNVPPAEPPKPVVRVPYVPEVVKDQLREEVKQEVLAQARAERWGEPGALPAWLSRLSFYGDVRVRYQREDYSSDNAPVQNIDRFYQLPDGTTKSSTDTRDRFRLRARFGVDAHLDEEFSAGARIVTANGDDLTANPVSYNVDEGRFGRPFSAGFDLAFLRWQPTSSVTVAAGRVANPYFASDLIWSPDLTFDGFTAAYVPRLLLSWNGFVTAGAHPLQTNQTGPFNTAPDQWLYAAQTGVSWTGADESSFRIGAAYYDYVGIEGRPNPVAPPLNTLNSLSAPEFRQRGNTMFNINWFSNPGGTPVWGLASKFKLVNVIAQYELAHYDPVRLALQLDWVRNIGFSTSDIHGRIGAAVLGVPQDSTGASYVDRTRVNGYRAGMQIGDHELRRFGDWQVFGGYRYLQRDAVVDAFTSPDYRLGGTDQKGTFAGVNLGLAARTSMQLRMISAKSLDAVPKFAVDTWFLDVLGRF